MNRWIFILAFIAAIPLAGNAGRKRALIVGISDYRSNGYRVWSNIHGCEDANLLKPELEKKGFKVQTLTDEHATCKGILRELSYFIASSKKGDIIYLHFSCHGQPVEDGLNGMEKDEKDGWDESLVPIDAGKTYAAKGYRGEKHITDDQLNMYVTRLRRKIGAAGMVYVTIDACHAGNMEREDFETIRGSNEGLTRNPNNKYNPPGKHKPVNLVSSPELAAVLYVEACESWQRNQEVCYGGREYGALTFNIWQCLRREKSFPKDSHNFEALLRKNIRYNTDRRNRLWPTSQRVVFTKNR